MEILALLAAAAVLIVLESELYRRFGLKRIEYSRRFSRHTATEGDELQMIEVIGNRKPLPLPWLRVESRMAPQLLFGRRADMEVAGLRYHRSVFFLSPYQQVTRRHRVKASKRGVYRLDSVTFTMGDLFGVSERTQTLPVNDELIVYPREMRFDQLLPMLGTQGDAITRRYILPDPFLFRGVRPMRPGDSPRDIHWRATAKKREPYVRETETTRNSELTIILNTQMFDDQWDNLSEAQREEIEPGVRLALSIGNRALRDGCRVGFLSNGVLVDHTEPACLPPAGGSGQMARLADALARLQIVRHTSFPRFLETQTQLRGQDVLLLSYYDSEALRHQMRALNARGNQTALIVFKGGAQE